MIVNAATIDTNIIGHLYRSHTQFLIENLFSTVYVDEQIMIELKRRCKDVVDPFEEELLKEDALYCKVTKQELITDSLYSIYNIELNGLEDLFLPSDEGEKRAIALAKTKGAFFLLTDDTKPMDGPTHMIENGLIPEMEVLAFWDLIFLNTISGCITHEKAKDTYEFVASDGYIPDGFRSSFRSKMNQSMRRLAPKEWFTNWCKANGIRRQTIKDFKSYVSSIID